MGFVTEDQTRLGENGRRQIVSIGCWEEVETRFRGGDHALLFPSNLHDWRGGDTYIFGPHIADARSTATRIAQVLLPGRA